MGLFDDLPTTDRHEDPKRRERLHATRLMAGLIQVLRDEHKVPRQNLLDAVGYIYDEVHCSPPTTAP